MRKSAAFPNKKAHQMNDRNFIFIYDLYILIQLRSIGLFRDTVVLRGSLPITNPVYTEQLFMLALDAGFPSSLIYTNGSRSY